MAEDFPRLLVATEFSPNASGGGPAVVRQMLKGWPVEKLFWWSCHADSTGKFGQKVAAHRVAAIPRKLYPHQRWCSQKSWVLEHLWTPWAGAHFQKTVREFQPEAIWIIAHQWAIPPLVRWLHRTPVAFHASVHDYMDVASSMMRFGKERSQRLVGGAEDLYREAATRDAICQPMLEDLQAKTGRDGLITRAGLEPEDFDFLGAVPKPSPEKIRIAYAGTILVEDAFAIFVSALEKIRRQLARPVTLEIFGSHSYRNRRWFDSSWMIEHGELSLPQLSMALKGCSWGFLPMSLANEDPRYNQFSLPTKLISYLAAGLPVISLGHPASSVMKITRAYKVGLSLATSDLSVMASELAVAFASPNPRAAYAPEIQRCALTEFDATRMRHALHENFHNCARQNRRNKRD